MHLKKLLLLLTLIVTSTQALVHREEINTGSALARLDGETSQINKPFLWRVTRGEQAFYLFGTIHLDDGKTQKLPRLLTDAIAQSDEVRTELPMTLSTQLQSLRLMSRMDGKRLSEIIPIQLYNDAREYVREVSGADMFPLYDTMKVWAAGMMLSFIGSVDKSGELEDIDTLIYDHAKNLGKKVGGIETVEEQTSMFDPLTLDEQIMLFESSLKYLREHRDSNSELIELYLEGDGEKLYDFMMSTLENDTKYKALNEKAMQFMLYDRNSRMVRRIETLSEANPKKVFLFAFGVLHFLGERSIIEHLRKSGYDVTRVK